MLKKICFLFVTFLGALPAQSRVPCVSVGQNLDQIEHRLDQVKKEDQTRACEKLEFRNSEGVVNQVKIFCDNASYCAAYKASTVPAAVVTSQISNCDPVIIDRNQARIDAFRAQCSSTVNDRGCTVFKCEKDNIQFLKLEPCLTYSSEKEMKTAEFMLEGEPGVTFVKFKNPRSQSGNQMEVHFKQAEACEKFKKDKYSTSEVIPLIKDAQELIREM